MKPLTSESGRPTRPRTAHQSCSIHSLMLLPSSWDRFWATVFEQAGFATAPPGWPDDPPTVAEAESHPSVRAQDGGTGGRRVTPG